MLTSIGIRTRGWTKASLTNLIPLCTICYSSINNTRKRSPRLASLTSRRNTRNDYRIIGKGKRERERVEEKKTNDWKKTYILCKEQTCLLETTLRATVKNTYKCVEIIQRFRGCIDKIFGFGSFGFGCFTFRGIVSPRTPRIYDSLFFFFLPPPPPSFILAIFLLECKKYSTCIKVQKRIIVKD